jgi:hypothetical protein
MKKITLVLAMLLAFGLVMASAQELTVTGEANAKIGYDLEDGTFGMDNDSEVTLDLDLASGTVATEAADGWYGWIEIEDFSIAIDEDEFEDIDDDDTDDVDEEGKGEVDIDTGDVTAKIINGPMYITIWGADGFEIDAAPEVEDDDPDDDDYAVEDDDDDLDLDLSNGTGGFTFGYMADAFDIEVHFAT